MANHNEEVNSAMLKEIAKMKRALQILQSYNRLHHDFDAYLYEIAEWGLGGRPDKPDPKDYGVER